MTTKRLKGGLDPRAFDRDGNLKWAVVAAIMSENGDREYTAAQIRNIAHRALKKLKAALLEAEGHETKIALAYFADMEDGRAAYEAWRHRIAPKPDTDYQSWSD